MTKFPKERKIVRILSEFVNDRSEDADNVAVLIGGSKTGKTIALKQLANHFSNAVYKDFTDPDAWFEAHPYFDDPNTIVLIDNVTSKNEYDADAVHIVVHSYDSGNKVIMTGANVDYTMKLYMRLKGVNGISSFFLLKPSYMEYLHLSGQHNPCDDFRNHMFNVKKFEEYLNSNILSGFRINYNKMFFREMHEMRVRTSELIYYLTPGLELSKEQAESISLLLDRKFSNAKENKNLDPIIHYQDFADLDICKGDMAMQVVRNLLLFMISEGLAYVDSNVDSIHQIISKLMEVKQMDGLLQFFNKHSLVMADISSYLRWNLEEFNDEALDFMIRGLMYAHEKIYKDD
jgi:hypothetical protein